MKRHAYAKLIIGISLSLTLTLLCAIALTLSLGNAPLVAKATNNESDFTQVFPTADYFQSSNPGKVSANRNYLIIFDDVAKRLFVRSDSAIGTYSYSADFENVDNVFAIGDTAFLNDGGNYYTLDLTDRYATWINCTLSSPSNIKFFNTDGTHLYAHSAFGAVTVYDENLNVAFNADNLQDEEFSGLATVVMGENDQLYIFSIEAGNPFFMTYDVTTKQKSERVYINGLFAEAYVGDVIYALKSFDDVKRIVCVDKTSGNELFSTQISPDAFFAYGNRLFTISENAVTIYTLNSDKNGLTRNSTVTMSGSDEGHFNNPTDIIKNGDKIIVADSDNYRLQIITSSDVQSIVFDEKPFNVTNKANDYYVSFANCVRKISNGNIVATYEISNVLDLTYLDKLYVLTQDGLYTLLGNKFIKLTPSYDAKRVACAKDGTNVYLLTDTEVIAISPSGAKLPSLAIDDFTNAVDLSVDYEGKVTVAFKHAYNQYLKDDKTTYTLTSSTLSASVTSVCLDGTSLYFTAQECFVGKTNIDAQTSQTYTFNAPQISKDNVISFATPNENALYYSADGRVENISFASEQTVLVYENIDVGESGSYKYARYGETIVKIAISDFESVEPSPLSGDYVTKSDTSLHVSPYCEDGKISIEKGAILTRISDVAGYDKNAWTIVEYDGNRYFVKSNSIEEYVITIPEEEKVYGKANADRVGGTVKVYAEQYDSSQVVAEIIDGEKVEVLETLDNYYLVNANGIIGYVKKDNLKLDGLTTVQIVAIVLAIVVALAGTAIFASIYITRKNSENKKEEEKTQKRF